MNKHFYCLIFTFFLLRFEPVAAQEFYGTFDLANWQFSGNGGSVNTGGMPYSFQLTGSNLNIPDTADFFIIFGGQCPATISFDWEIINHPDCGYDSLFYGINDSYTFLTACDSSGTVGPIQLLPGDLFTIRISTPDGEFGAPTVTIDHFVNSSIVLQAETLPPVVSPCRIESLTPPTAIDGCGNTFSAMEDVVFPLTASTTIHWYFTDVDGNYVTQQQQVVIEDFDPPVPTADSLYPVIGYCSVFPPQPLAEDACGGPTYSQCVQSLPITDLGSTIITWEYYDENGMMSTQQQTIIIEEIPIGLIANGQQLELIDPVAGNQYQWMDCDSGLDIPGANDSIFLTESDGQFYALEITNGSCTVTTECVSVSTSQLPENELDLITIYPNPSTGIVTVKNGNASQSDYQLIDLTGRVIQTGLLVKGSNTIDLSSLENGHYLLRLDETQAGKLLVKQ